MSNDKLRNEALWRVFVEIKLSLKGTECSFMPETYSNQLSSPFTQMSSLNTDHERQVAHFFSLINPHTENNEGDITPLPRLEERRETHVGTCPEASSASRGLNLQIQLGLAVARKPRAKLLVAHLLTQYAAPPRNWRINLGQSPHGNEVQTSWEPRKFITVMSRTL